MDVRGDEVGKPSELSTQDRAKQRRLATIYNQTLEEHNAKRAEQKDACAICRRPFSQFQAYQDHDHACCPRRKKRYCGKCNRGLLCYLCNKKAIGILEYMKKVDIPIQKAVDYITSWTAIIAAKGGYVPTAKATKSSSRVRKKQTGV